MKFILSLHFLMCILGTTLLYNFDTTGHSFSYFSGSCLLLLSVFLLSVGWTLIFEKKLIALAVSIIVFKYAILGFIMFTIVKLSWFNPLWFSLGIASFVITAVAYAITEALKEGTENVI